MAYGLIIALVLSLLFAFLLFHMMKKLLPVLLNGVLGIAVFWALGYFGILRVPLDFITFLIAAFGGLFGVLIVIALAALGIPL